MKNLCYLKKEEVQDIANAIREKSKTETTYLPSEMGNAIREIKGGEEEFVPSPNLFRYPYGGSMDKEIAGVTITDNGDGSFTVNGTSTSEFDIGIDTSCDIQPNGTYIFDLGIPEEYYSQMVFYEIKIGNSSDYIEVKKPFTTYEKASDYVIMLFLPGVTFDNLTFYPNLNEGTELKPWEPYKINTNMKPIEFATYLENIFREADFITKPNFEFKATSFKGVSISNMFSGATNIETLKMSSSVRNTTMNCGSAFINIKSIKEIDLSDFNRTISTSTLMFSGCSKLERIIGELDFSNCTAMNSTFASLTALQEVTLKEKCLKANTSFSNSPNLSNESIESIINGLANQTGTSARTLSLNSTVKNKLTSEQKARITNKNWNLA